MLTLFTVCIHECICDADNLQALMYTHSRHTHTHINAKEFQSGRIIAVSRPTHMCVNVCVCVCETPKKADRPTTIREKLPSNSHINFVHLNVWLQTHNLNVNVARVCVWVCVRACVFVRRRKKTYWLHFINTLTPISAFKCIHICNACGKKGKMHERKTQWEKEKKSKSGNDTHKPYHYTILPAKSIQWNFVHVKCLHLRSSSMCFHSLSLSLFRCFTWLHICLYFLFIFSHMCIFFLSIPHNFSGLLACLLLQHEYDAIFIPYVFSPIYIQKCSMDFSLFLKWKKQQQQQNLVQSTNWNFIFGPFFHWISMYFSQHNCSMLQN